MVKESGAPENSFDKACDSYLEKRTKDALAKQARAQAKQQELRRLATLLANSERIRQAELQVTDVNDDGIVRIIDRNSVAIGKIGLSGSYFTFSPGERVTGLAPASTATGREMINKLARALMESKIVR
jgi:hypothetical protein